ncbi:MAG: hypothetical protein ACYTDT_02695 [Planctomycetota bacterium]|jgi:hypothetical protein
MKTTAICLFVLLVVSVVVAEIEKPSLPKVPRGFDDGRNAVLKEAVEETNDGDRLLMAIWENADIEELAAFIHVHIAPDERKQLDSILKLKEKLTAADSSDQVKIVLIAAEIPPKDIAEAIAKMHEKNGFSLLDTVSWLYLRDLNFQVMNAAFDGERIDAVRLRTKYRKLVGKDLKAHELFSPGLWEFNLKDGREEQGGHYDGVQLVEVLLELGWGEDLFARAMRKKSASDLSDSQRTLIKWKDAELLWGALELRVSESELVAFAKKHYKTKTDKAAAEISNVATRRFNSVDRWFRTGGAGVVAVYQGPWPNAKGEPAPPKVAELKTGEEFVGALSADLWGHFSNPTSQLTLVVYSDGSARAMLNQSKRKPMAYSHDTPLGNIQSRSSLYEGRISLKGENGLLNLVFADGLSAGPSEIEFAHLVRNGGGALLSANIDDDINLTPILLRRVGRLVTQE